MPMVRPSNESCIIVVLTEVRVVSYSGVGWMPIVCINLN